MKVPSLKSGQMITLAYFIGILVILFIVYKILGAVGIIKTRAKKLKVKEEAKAETELRASEYFNPLFLKDKLSSYKPLKDSAKSAAHNLRNAMSGFGTNEEGIYTTFGRLKNKYNISEVSLYYLQEYKRDLLTDLLDELTAAEQVTLFDIINKLSVK